MPRVTKTKAAAAATPRRATRSSVRAGSATLEEPVAVPPTPSRRRGRSRSVTPTQDAESSLPNSQVEHLPALAEEEEKQPSPLAVFPEPADFAPIVDASPYITPRHYHHIAPSSQNSPSLNQSTSRAVDVYIDRETEEENDDPVQAQLAAETEEAGSSLLSSHKRSSLRHSTGSRKRRSVGGAGTTPRSSERSAIRTPSSVVHTPLLQVSGNAVSPLRALSYDVPNLTPSPKSPVVSLMDRVLDSIGYFEQLTGGQRTALLLDMRREIMRLRKVEEQYLAGSRPSPRQDSSPEMSRTIDRRRDLRFQMSIAKPAAEALAARNAAEAAASAQADSHSQVDQTPSRSNHSSTDKRRKSKTPQSQPSQAQTPQKSIKPPSPVETPSASPAWGLTSLFGSVRNIFAHRPSPSPTKQQPQADQESEQPRQQQQQLQASLMQSPTPKPKSKPKFKSPAPPATPTLRESTHETPVKSVRRRGVLPGSARAPRTRDSPRQKPKEANADRRAQQLEQGAEQAAERKRIQEQADKIEKERRRAEEEQKQRDADDAALQQAGSKRKRVRVDDLKVIPSKRPGQGSGSFGLVDEFFDYNSDEEDDYVEMDIDEIQYLNPTRPAKKARLDENVFQPKTPAAQPPALSPVKQTLPPPAAPTTPAPNYSEHTQQAIAKQRIQFSQHKPKQPSRLRNVERLSSGSTVASPPQTLATPEQPITISRQPTTAPQQKIVSPSSALEPITSTSQPIETPPKKTFIWPAAEPLCSPETLAKIDLLYTKEMRQADHQFFMDGFAAAMQSGY